MHPYPMPVGRKPVLQEVFLTATGLNDWLCPTDVSEIETVDCYGEGDGHGAAFARGLKVSVTPGALIPYMIAAGNSGIDTWFKTSATVKAAADGSAASSIGDLKYSGGAAGPYGGGGAAGPDGAGLPGSGYEGGAPNAGVGGGLGGDAVLGGAGSGVNPTASNVYGAGKPGPGGGGYGTNGYNAGNAANYGGGRGSENSEEPNDGADGQGLIRLTYYQ